MQEENDAYKRAIQDLNLLQSNSQVIALAKYENPEAILPSFRRRLQLACLEVAELDRLNVVHVSGTKGKGSTCAFAESILRRAGLQTGFYNSPHLIKCECMRTTRLHAQSQPGHSQLGPARQRRSCLSAGQVRAGQKAKQQANSQVGSGQPAAARNLSLGTRAVPLAGQVPNCPTQPAGLLL